MSALNDIKSILTTLAADEDVPMGAVYYGMCPETSLDTWNYFVFNRTQTEKASNRVDWQTHYSVSIIHEDYIPEGYVETVKDALEAGGFRWKAEAVTYNYTLKGSTSVVVEIATINLVLPEKRGGDT